MVMEFPKANVDKERHLLSRFWYERSIRKEFLGAPTGTERLPYVLQGIKERFKRLFKGKEVEFETLVRDMSSNTFANDGEIIEALTSRVLEFARANFTREELENIYGEPAFRGANKIYLNELLDCNLDQENDKRLKIHLKATSKLGMKAVSGGFKILADKLKNDTALSNVEIISVASYLVMEHPQVFEKLGFTLLDIDEEDKMLGDRRGEMSRAEFIERYGSEN